MRLFECNTASDRQRTVCLLFGSGLVGSAVAQALRRTSDAVAARRLDWNWQAPDPAETAAVEAAARTALAVHPESRLAVIWTAGRSGFGTTDDGMVDEFAAFERVTDLARRLGTELPLERRAFVHVSSAGGLFEGQVACGPDADPAPLRPYGHGKLAQERHVHLDATLGRRLIVRPTSVYGYASGGRRGLVSALTAAAIQGNVATIFGALTTQRDFVFAPDVGRHIAARVLEPWPAAEIAAPETILLASARPASVFEVIGLVEAQLGVTLYLRIDPRPENARDNTFLPSALPRDFRPTALQEGIARTAMAVSEERFMGAKL